MTRVGVYLAAMDALKAAMQFDRAADVCDEATRRLTGMSTRGIGPHSWYEQPTTEEVGGNQPEVGLELIEQALEIYSRSVAPSAGYVQALHRQFNLLLDQLGRYDDAYEVVKTAVEAAEDVGGSAAAPTDSAAAGLA